MFPMACLAKLPVMGRPLTIGTLCLMLLLPVRAQAQSSVEAPAQWPLLNQVLPPVKPNLMITLDDSSSMTLRHLPDTDTEISIGAFRIKSPVTSVTGTVKFAPDEPGIFSVTTDRGSPDWPQRFLRSADTNPIYYNPEIRYRPWLRADGTRYPNASIAAAVINPADPVAKTVNLRDTVDDMQARWCSGAPMVCSSTTKGRTYVPGLYYRLRRENGNYLDPARAGSYDEFDVNSPSGLPRSPARSDCAGATCSQAEEQQNFANWFVYYRNRLLFAKSVLGEVMAQLPNQIRVGYGRLGQPRGDVDGIGKFGMIVSGVRDFSLDRRRDFLSWLYGLNATAATPLREAIQEVGTYFSSSDPRGPWGEAPGSASSSSQLACRRAYHLLVTDGEWTEPPDLSEIPENLRDRYVTLTSVGNVDGTGPAETPPAGSWHYTPATPYQDTWVDQLADYALYFWAKDLRPDLPDKVKPIPGNEASWQSLSNFIVGLGVIGKLDPASDLPALQAGTKTWSDNKIDDLWHATLNSHGQYFSASNSAALQSALRQSLASMAPSGSIQGGVGAGSGADADFVKYLPTFRPSDWSGDLQAWSLDATGRVGAQKWRAEAALPPWQERRLFIWDDGQDSPGAVKFEWGLLSQPLRTAMGSQANAALVDFIRGSRTLEEDGGWRVRGGLLGDFINSTPLVAGAAEDPALRRLPTIGGSYGGYLRDTKAARPRVVYIGGNDGMLHAFRDGVGADGSPAGREIFGYLPRAVASQLHALRNLNYNQGPEQHLYYVDGPLREVDVYVSPPGGGSATWRNYLLGSTGAGPAAVFAIDITNPLALGASSPRWEVSGEVDPRLGHVLAPLAAGMLPNGRWVALFGNGYGSRSGRAHLFVVELEGGVVHTLELPDVGAANGLGGVALAKDSAGRVTSVYAGDLTGRLWRLDFSEQASSFFVVGLGGQPLFRGESGQPIIQAPVLQPRGAGRLLMFGTGRLVTSSDLDDTTGQALYVVEDRLGEGLLRPLGPSQLAVRSLQRIDGSGGSTSIPLYSVTGEEIDWTRQRGWRLSLTGNAVPKGLRMLQPIQALSSQGDLVLIAAEAPAKVSDLCAESATGSGINLLLPFVSGLPLPGRPLLDTNSDGIVDTRDDRRVVGYATQSDGADVVLARPRPSGLTPPASGSGSGATTGSGADWTCTGQGLLASASGAVAACLKVGLALRDRAWRRILQAPF